MRKTLLTLAILSVAGTLTFAGGTGEGAATGDVPTLTMFGGQQPSIKTLDSPENEFTAFMEDKFGVNIEWLVGPSEGDPRREKQNLLIASGDYPEIFWQGRFLNSDQMRYGGQGVLQPLDDLIDTHAPDILAAFAFKSYFRPEITTPDGNIYSLPHFEECYHCSVRQKLWMNQTWLDALGLEQPTTTAELERVLLAFKNRDPNGNGKADEIPLTGATGTWMADVWHYPMTAFIYDDGERFLYINDRGEVDVAANKPQWRDGLRYLNRLFEQGLIDPQAFTQNLDAARAVVNAEPTAVGAYTAGHNRLLARNDDLWQQYPAVPPLRGPGGIRQSAYYPSGVGDGKFAITNKANDVQARKAIEMANFSYTEEGTLMQIWGLPKDGENWRWAQEGELGLNGEPAIYYGAVHAWERTNRTDAWGQELIFWHFDLFNGWAGNQDVTSIEGYERFLVVESDKYIDFVPDQIVRENVYIAEDKAQRIAQIRTDVESYVTQNAAAFITGQRDIERDWDAYVRGFEGLGIKEYLETMREAVK